MCAICLVALLVTGFMSWSINVERQTAQREVSELNDLNDALAEFRVAAANTRAAFYEYVSKPFDDRAGSLERSITSSEILVSAKIASLPQADLLKESRERLQRLTGLQKKQAEVLFESQRKLGSVTERQNWYGSSGGLGAIGELARAGEQLEVAARKHAEALPTQEALLLSANVLRLRTKEADFAVTQDSGAEGDLVAASDRVGKAIANLRSGVDELKPLYENYVAKFENWSRLIREHSNEIDKMDSFYALSQTPLNEAKSIIAKKQADAVAFLDELRVTSDRTMLGTFVIAALVSAVFSVLIAKSVTSPLAALRQIMSKVAAGETNLAVPHATDKDEIGEMARAVEVFRDTAIERQQLVATQLSEAEKRAGRGQEVEQQIRTFDHNIGETLIALRKAAEKLDSAAIGLKTASSEVDRRCSEAGGAATSTAQRVTVVASAADQLVNSIREISEQTARSSGVAERADKQAEETMTHMTALVQSVEKIGEFTGLIGAIASQTNLLALNATIEAARAGDAGRGFAVVASEVKNLASQTANATEEISRLIGVVHHSSTESMKAVGSVSNIIADMRHISVALASAMHEQDAGIAEIASSMNVLSEEARIGATAVGSAEQAARSAASIAQQVGELANLLGDATGDIDGNVSDFLATVRAA
ncbi:MAG: methyl-accepting chemotaxis protein [Beijerinckiaceae bacterium]|nr:methyl-accepting chemotaxis protein [Beijerinckiaceae bacterium]